MPRISIRIATVALLACAAMGGAACAGGEPRQTSPAAFVDDFGDSVTAGPALRIVSLNPVTTELLYAAGLGDRVVGRTHWDLYPEAARGAPDLGDGIQPNVEVVVGARPDLVLLYASPSNRRAATALRAAGIRTLAVRTDHIGDLVRVASAIAAVTADSSVLHVADSALATVDSVRRIPRPARPPRVVWHLGEPPIYVAGRGSFAAELVEAAGAVNVFDDLPAPSPTVSIEEIGRRDPDLILVGPAGARRLARTPAWRAVRAVREGHIAVYDTALVVRPGVRIGEAAVSVRRLLARQPGGSP